MKKIFAFFLCSCLINSVAFAEELSLEDSVAIALEKNENIMSAKASRDKSRYNLSAVRRSSGLIISWSSRASRIGGGYYRSYRSAYNPGLINTRTYEVESSGDPYSNEFTNNFSARFPLYTGGQLEGQIKSAGFQAAAADLTLERARQEIRFNTMQAYYTLLQRQNLLNIAKEGSDTAKEQLNLITIQYEEGAVPKADMLQMQVQLASYSQELVSAKGSVEVAMYQLARLLGKDGENIVLKDKLTYIPFPLSLAETENFALVNRPESVIGAFNVKQAEAALTTARAGYKPKVNAIYTRNIADNNPFLRDGRTETWAMGVDVSWSVFDNFVTDANVKAAKSEIERAKASEANTKKTVILETRSAYAQMKAAELNIKSTETAVAQAKENFEITRVRYDEGVDNLLAVTTAQERLTRAETNYYNALYNYNLYKAQLEKAAGFPVMLNVEMYQKALNNNPNSSERLDKTEETSMIKKTKN